MDEQFRASRVELPRELADEPVDTAPAHRTFCYRAVQLVFVAIGVSVVAEICRPRRRIRS